MAFVTPAPAYDPRAKLDDGAGVMELLALAAQDLEAASRICSMARFGEQIEVYISMATRTLIEVRQGDVGSFVSSNIEGMGIRVISDGRMGFSYSGTGVRSSMADTLAHARANAALGSPDVRNALPKPDGVRASSCVEVAHLSVGEAIEAALRAERAAEGLSPRVRVEFVEYLHQTERIGVVSSTGICNQATAAHCTLSVDTILDDPTGAKTGDYSATFGSGASLDPEDIGKTAARKALTMLGAVNGPSGRSPMILSPLVVADLLSVYVSALSGSAAAQGKSMLKAKVGERIASPCVSIVDDPLSCAAFVLPMVDGEGLAVRRNDLVENGLLRGHLQSDLTGRRVGSPSTGNAVRSGFRTPPRCGSHAVQISSGDLSQEELVERIDEAVVIRTVHGVEGGVNRTTGDFTLGATGALVRRSELAQPIQNFTIAGNLRDLFNSVTALGSETQWNERQSAGVAMAVRELLHTGSLEARK